MCFARLGMVKKKSQKSRKEIKPVKNADGFTSEIIEIELNFEHAPSEKKTHPQMTKYEYTTLIYGQFMYFCATGKVPETTNPSLSLIQIATLEIDRKNTTLVVQRKLTDGTIENWKVQDMILPR